MKKASVTIPVWGLLTFSIALSLPPRAGSAASLGKRYINPLYGFSFREPAGTQRKGDFSKSRLVSWLQRDENTGAIAWTLTVLHAKEEKADIRNLREYAGKLVGALKKKENFQISVSEVTTVAGKPAIDLQGLGGGKLFWQRQLWVNFREKQFLIFRISGPMTLKREMADVAWSVAKTLQVVDPTAAREQRSALLRAGQALLDGITDREMVKVIRRRPYWFLLMHKKASKPVGFVRIAETTRSAQGADGYLVTTWAMIQMPKVPAQLARREMFTTANRSLTRWNEQWQAGSGATAQNGAENGIKQNETVVCNIQDHLGKITTKTKRVPQHIYLPRAMGTFLPRLVDRGKPRAYAFATYTSSANDMDMRTFTVVGPDTMRTTTGTTRVTKIFDRPAEDQEPTTMWVDANGWLLRMQTVSGLIMDASTEAGVRRYFPKANLVIGALDGKKILKQPPKKTGP